MTHHKQKRPPHLAGSGGASDRSWEMLIRSHRTEFQSARQGHPDGFNPRPVGEGGQR